MGLALLMVERGLKFPPRAACQVLLMTKTCGRMDLTLLMNRLQSKFLLVIVGNEV